MPDQVGTQPTPVAQSTSWNMLASLFEILVFLSIAATLFGTLGRWHFLPDLLTHFRLQTTGTLLLASVVLWLLRRKRWSLISLLFGGILLFTLTPYFRFGSEVRPANGDYRLVTMNVLTANPLKAEVIAYLRAEAPDFILLQETDQNWIEALDSQLAAEWPYSKSISRADNFGVAIYSKHPWTECESFLFSEAVGTPSVVAEFALPNGETLRLVATHPVPPMNELFWRSRNELFSNLADFVATRGAARTIVVGDLNCTPWSPHFDQLLKKSGLANSAIGRGLRVTWMPIPIAMLGLPIDHVLVGEQIKVSRRDVGPYLGSDHRPIVVDFR